MTENAEATGSWPPKAKPLTVADRREILAETHRALREIVPWHVAGQERHGDGGTTLADMTFDPGERARFGERRETMEMPSSPRHDDDEYRARIDERDGITAYCMEGEADCMWVAGHYARKDGRYAVTLTAATFTAIDFEKEDPMDLGLDEAMGRARRDKAVLDLEAVHGVEAKPVRLRVTRSEVREAWEELDAMSRTAGRHWAHGSTPMAALLANGVDGLSLPDRKLEGMAALEALGRDFGRVEHRTITLDTAEAMGSVANRHVPRYAGTFKAAVAATAGRRLAGKEVAIRPTRTAARASAER